MRSSGAERKTAPQGYIRFPPGSEFLLLPASSRRAFRAGLSLWSACRPAGRFLRSGIRLATGLLGTAPLRLLGQTECAPPVDGGLWEEMVESWGDWFGPVERFAFYSPRQQERRGFAVLLIRQGDAVGFVKARPEHDFTGEAAALDALGTARSFQVPRPVGVESVGGWKMLGLTPVPDETHSPQLREPVEAVTSEISRLLDSAIAKPVGTPPDWIPMHGDLGPWNLRRVRSGKPVVFDFEHCTYAPPGADLVFHHAACVAMRIRSNENLRGLREAAAFWRGEIPRRFAGEAKDQALANGMLGVLEGLPE